MLFRHNTVTITGLILILGVIAVLLWPFASIIETTIRIPVKVSDIPDGLILIGQPPSDLELIIRGHKSVIKALPGRFPYYALNLSTVKEGQQTVALDAKNIFLPKTIKIKKITPPSLNLTIEKKIRKALPIDLLLSGKPASGYTLTGTVVKPDVVVVTGPARALTGIVRIRTKPINITGTTESFKKEITIDLPENVVMAAPDKIILAEIHVDHRITTRKFSGITVMAKNTPHAVTITPPKIDLEIQGPVNLVDNFYLKKTPDVFVDLKGLEPGIYVRRATISLPVKIILTGVSPEVFSVNIIGK